MEPLAERWLKPVRELAGLSMWQPHTKVNTQKGETGFESWWTLLVPLAPALPSWGVSFGVSLFSALEVPRGDHTLEGRAAVRGPSRTGTNPRTGKQDRYPTARSRKTARHCYFEHLFLPKFEGIVLLGSYAPDGVLWTLLVFDVSVLYFVISRYWVSKEVSREQWKR